MSILNQIIKKNDCIIDFLMDYNKNDLSIFGILGINLTLINYGINKNDESYISKALQNIENIQSKLQNNIKTISVYGQGLISLGVFIDYIEKYQIADIDSNLLKVIIYSGFQNGTLLLKSNNLDFVAGATGIGFYFVNKIQKVNFAHNFLSEWVNKTYNLTKNKIIVYDKHLSNNNKKIINLGLAHGLTNILKLALKLNKIEFETHKTRIIINKIIQFYKNIVTIENEYFYPHTITNSVINKDFKSRMAWCYGDLSLAYILYQASLFLNDLELNHLALNILKQTTIRKKIEETQVVDASLCHGSSGIAHIYNKIFNYTNDEVFRTAHTFWLQYTLNLAHNKNGTLGYIIPNNTDKKKEVGLLSGIAGISLSFQSSIFNTFDWDFCLLLDEI